MTVSRAARVRAARVRGVRVTGLLACLLAAPALFLGGAWLLNDIARSDRIDADAVRAARELSGRVGALDTLMAVLGGMRADRAQDDGGELIMLASRLRAQVPFVTALGRYRRVEADERDAFVDSMSERGLYDVRIRRVGRDTDVAAVAHPISMLEPMRPDNVALLGADLGAIDGLADRIDTSVARDEPILIEVPDEWAGPGGLMLLRPTYLGIHAPTLPGLRRAQADGGVWAMIDLERLLGDSAAGFDASVSIGGDGDERVVHRSAAAPLDSLVLAGLYAPAARHERWRVGTDWLDVSLTPRPGMAPRYLVISGLLTALILCALGLLSVALRQRRRHLDSHARYREELYRASETSARTLAAIRDAVIGIDRDAVVHHLNPAAERLVGRAAGDASGTRLDELLPLIEENGTPFDPVRAIDALRRHASIELDVRPAGDPAAGDPAAGDPGDTVFKVTLTRTARADDVAGGHVVVLRDVSDARRLNRALERQANHDALTGCTNRLHFERRLEELVADRTLSSRTHSLLYMDLDQFKVVNDTCGHAAGDRLLVELTERLGRLVRCSDTLSRLGGDEFGLIIVDASPAEARAVAESIHGAFQSMLFTSDQKIFPIRASLGLVHLDEHGTSAMDLMAAADMACYAAKENGRNELVVYQDERERMAMRSTELDWLSRLQHALDENAFRLHLQPIASIGEDRPGGRIEHFEFLLRLADENGCDFTPWQIVQAAERYGLMRRLDRWIITHALDTVARHAPSLPPGTGFSINLSGQSAADASLIDFITEGYERFGTAPGMIGFELTETAAIASFDTAVELVRGIRALGSQVSLDDFGSGLSSFGYLRNLPVNVLKIDGQFVREIAHNDVDRTMVKAIAEIGRSMGIRTVAEFVEDQAIVDVLVELGIDYAQGYHIARPMPVEQALELLDRPGRDVPSRAA